MDETLVYIPNLGANADLQAKENGNGLRAIHGNRHPEVIMSLKLRLNLIITLLLTMVFVAGIILNIINARQNVRAEVDSTEKLALYLFDTGLLQNPGEVFSKTANNPLRLQSLKHMRHVRIEFYHARINF